MTNGVGAALITGAGRRIGAAIAEALAAERRPVALHCHESIDGARALAQRIVARGGRAAVVVGDLADPATPERLVLEATAAVGAPLEALVNNASTFEEDEIGALESVAWDRQMAVNLRAPVFLAQAFAARLPANVGGCVVNVIDQRVLKTTSRFVSYALSKSALRTATETLALALAPRVRVVAVAPGPTLANARQSPEAFARQAEATPLRRGPTPAEIAEAVRFLLNASSVTGVMLPVDGGQHLAADRDDD